MLVALQGGQKQAKELMLDAELRNRNAADILLHKMVKDGEIVRAERGLYGLPGKDSGKIGKERSETKAFETKDENGNLSDLSGGRGQTDWDDYPNLPALRRSPVRPTSESSEMGNRPALGPAGDSLDDFTA